MSACDSSAALLYLMPMWNIPRLVSGSCVSSLSFKNVMMVLPLCWICMRLFCSVVSYPRVW